MRPGAAAVQPRRLNVNMTRTAVSGATPAISAISVLAEGLMGAGGFLMGEPAPPRRRLPTRRGATQWPALVRLADGAVCEADIHWYEAHGIGRKDFKIKRKFFPQLP